MRNLFVLLLLTVFSVTFATAQDTTLVEQAGEKEMTIDQQINSYVEPASDFISDIVFYSIPVKSEVEYIKVTEYTDDLGNKGEGKVFMDPANCPYRMITDAKDGKEYRIYYQDENTYLFEYFFSDEKGSKYKVNNTYAFGEEVQLNEDFKFTLELKDRFKGQQIKEVYRVKPNTVTIPIVLIVLLLGALFFTIYFAFPNITKLRLSINTVRGKYVDPEAPKGQGEVTPFQALTAALSATVGLGNIAGVAIAITIGGPGATLWMIIAGILGMASKFTECTLGVKYREIGDDGTVYGGPMYYLSKGLKEMGLGGLGKFFAAFFAIMCVGGSFGGGNMFQSNQAASQTISQLGIEGGGAGFIFGLIVAVLVGIVIIGGIKRIGKVTERVVPFMAVLYVGAALFIIFANFSQVPTAFNMIFEGAFAPKAIAGGLVGVLIQGFQRAAFSNEAGVGSAAIAHSAVRTEHPASEGMVALLEPFIDTVVICTMTALVIVITGNHINPEELDGVELTSQAFQDVIPGFDIVLTVAVVLFAFSSMLSWSYYGLQSWLFLFGKGRGKELTYKILFCVFVVLGASAELGAVVSFSDAMIFAMVFPNVIGLVLLAPKVRQEVKRYMQFVKEFEAKES